MRCTVKALTYRHLQRQWRGNLTVVQEQAAMQHRGKDQDIQRKISSYSLMIWGLGVAYKPTRRQTNTVNQLHGPTTTAGIPPSELTKPHMGPALAAPPKHALTFHLPLQSSGHRAHTA